MQPVEIMWCDHVRQQSGALREGFQPHLDAATSILEDPLHIIGRYAHEVPDEHPLKGGVSHSHDDLHLCLACM
jgi:hypothetical protein